MDKIIYYQLRFGIGGFGTGYRAVAEEPSGLWQGVKDFYGKDIVDKFVNLFTDHLLIAADLVNYAKAGDNQGAEKARKEWFANADEIAAFLASINPHWSQSEWRRMLYDHLEKPRWKPYSD